QDAAPALPAAAHRPRRRAPAGRAAAPSRHRGGVDHRLEPATGLDAETGAPADRRAELRLARRGRPLRAVHLQPGLAPGAPRARVARPRRRARLAQRPACLRLEFSARACDRVSATLAGGRGVLAAIAAATIVSQFFRASTG